MDCCGPVLQPAGDPAEPGVISGDKIGPLNKSCKLVLPVDEGGEVSERDGNFKRKQE